LAPDAPLVEVVALANDEDAAVARDKPWCDPNNQRILSPPLCSHATTHFSCEVMHKRHVMATDRQGISA
jgi:hypothetical protein